MLDRLDIENKKCNVGQSKSICNSFWVMCFSIKCITACEHTHGKYTVSFVVASMLPTKFTFDSLLLYEFSV